jgi:hypothetical protein
MGNDNTQQSISKAWLGHSEPQLRISWRGKQWYLRSLKYLRRTGCSYRPIGPPLQTDMAKWGFLSY